MVSGPRCLSNTSTRNRQPSKSGTNAMRNEKEVREYVASLGGAVLTVRRNHHWVVTAEFEGQTIWFTVPVSASDHRSMKNNAKWIMGQVRQAKEKARWTA